MAEERRPEPMPVLRGAAALLTAVLRGADAAPGPPPAGAPRRTGPDPRDGDVRNDAVRNDAVRNDV